MCGEPVIAKSFGPLTLLALPTASRRRPAALLAFHRAAVLVKCGTFVMRSAQPAVMPLATVPCSRRFPVRGDSVSLTLTVGGYGVF